MKSRITLSLPAVVSLCCALNCGARVEVRESGFAGSGGSRNSIARSPDGAGEPPGQAPSAQGGRVAVLPDGGRAGFAVAGLGNLGAAGANDTSPIIGGKCSALSAGASSYVARKTRTLPSPVPNVVGVATDATSLWLLSATRGNGLATVTRYALPAAKILLQFQTLGFILPSGSDFYGIEVSADTVYLSVAGPDYSDITTYDPTTREATGDFESGSGWVPSGVGPSDLALLDGKLLVAMGSGTLETVQFEPKFEREIFTSYAPDSGRDSGVATCNEFVLWGGLYEGIAVLDRAGQAIGSVVQSDGQPFRQPNLGALAFFGDQLVIAAPDALAFYSLEAMP